MQNYQKTPTNPTSGFVIRHCMPYAETAHSSCSIFYEVKVDPYHRLHELFVDTELISEFYDLELNAAIQAQLQQVQHNKAAQLKLVAHYHLDDLAGNLLSATGLEYLQAKLPQYSPDTKRQIQVINPKVSWDAQLGEGFWVAGTVWSKGVNGYGLNIHEVLFEGQDVSAAFTCGEIASRLFGESLATAFEEAVQNTLTQDDIEMYKTALQASLDKQVVSAA